jgi:hypothetical protein
MEYAARLQALPMIANRTEGARCHGLGLVELQLPSAQKKAGPNSALQQQKGPPRWQASCCPTPLIYSFISSPYIDYRLVLSYIEDIEFRQPSRRMTMNSYVLTATTSDELSDQVDAFNELDDVKTFEHRKCYCNWGREGDMDTYFANGTYGKNVRTNLSFAEVVAYVQEDMDLTVEMINNE